MKMRSILFAAACVFSDAALSQEDFKVLYQRNGTIESERVGVAVDGAGDVNLDGFADFIVGASGAGTTQPFSGNARIFSGKDGAILYTFNGDNADDALGFSVAGAGDVNGDGVADVIVGIPWSDQFGSDSGSARVFSGKNGALIWELTGSKQYSNFGYRVAAAGDVNADGYSDVIVGTPFDDTNANDSGLAVVYSGATGQALFEVRGTSAGEQLGSAVAGAGDINKDGRDDFIVGVPNSDQNGTDSGSVRVISGKDWSTIHLLKGAAAHYRFGSAVAGAGDVNGDGYLDIVVGAPGSAQESGSATVFSGKNGSVIFNLNGKDELGNFGFTVAGAGDFTGDGLADVIIGGPYAATNVGNGKVQVFSGRDGKLTHTFLGGSNENLGWSVSGAGDINRDGLVDIILGGPNAEAFALQGGRFTVVSDGCPNDSSKAAPGLCGCGVVDNSTDTDSDGTPDCVDQCPLDAAKISPNKCGCGRADLDSDSDGTPDCLDLCPLDPQKIDNCAPPVSNQATPTPGPAPKLLNAPMIKRTKGSVVLLVSAKLSGLKRIRFFITGSKNLVKAAKQVTRPKNGVASFQSREFKLAKGSYEAFWEILSTDSSTQRSSSRKFVIK
jgi:hypothetical protein